MRGVGSRWATHAGSLTPIAGFASTITDNNVGEFWESNKKYEPRRGCYVFAIRAGRGYTPGYIGKATKGFKNEVFEYHNVGCAKNPFGVGRPSRCPETRTVTWT